MKIHIPDKPAVEPGTYAATFVSVEDRESQRTGDPYRRWTFDLDGSSVTGVSSTSWDPMSKSYRWLAAVLGRDPMPSEGIDAGTLRGRPCVIRIAKDDNGFPNVKDVTPVADRIRSSEPLSPEPPLPTTPDGSVGDDLPF